MKIVIALGGNALGSTPGEQIKNAKITAKNILPIIKEHNCIITHGNGPQVGLINLAFDEGKKVNDKVYEMPFAECGAMSEGYIGFHLVNAIKNELKIEGIKKDVISVLTNVLVDKNDEAFDNPTKPIGSFYTEEEAKKSPFVMKEDANRGYRRVVASPKPLKIIEEDAIIKLSDNGFIVVACGGGGIPIYEENNKYIPVDAVIDKDYASSKLASDIKADMLLILTAVKNAKINFGKTDEKDLGIITKEEAKNYLANNEFKAGSMKPKIVSLIDFIEQNEKGTGIITDIFNAYDAINLKCGTIIKN